jgi:hypothetical protein
MRPHSTFARLFLAATFATTSLPTTSARAETPVTPVCPLKLGEVSSNVKRDNVDLPKIIRDAAEDKLGAFALGDVPAARRSILSISLTRMETHALERRVEVDCVVSVAMRRVSDGAIYAILDGHARTEGESAPAALEERALRVAVHGALDNAPRALR